MITLNVSVQIRRLGLAVLGGSIAVLAAACSGGGPVTASTPIDNGGGGTGASATPYVLFASNYVAYASQTNGAYLHSIQGGDLYAGFGGHYAYGCYSAPQSDIDRTMFYNIQAQADGDGNCGLASSTVPNTAGDYVYVAVKAPGTNSPSATSITPVDISQSGSILIAMGNTATPDATHGHANVFTVALTNDTKGDGSASSADCYYDQTLTTVGPSGPSALGILNYAIQLSAFTCTKGTIATLQSTGVTTVAVKITGDKNPNVVAGEFDTIALGYIGFTK